ncbi:MAG TPA: Cj0069 family protein [Pyrinomonadaceae bacterium]
MKERPVIGVLLYCAEGGERDVFAEAKYRGLAERFVESGMDAETVLYNDERADRYRNGLGHLDALLVWVNPVEQGRDRSVLDPLLEDLSGQGLFVSSLPETIQKIGTKKVLFDTRGLEFGSDVDLYISFDDFKAKFPGALDKGKSRVLKRFRGNGGDGVFKVRADGDRIVVLHAKRGSVEETKTTDEFFEEFRGQFDGNAPMLDQEWNDNIKNGMVRCYMARKRVAGFGYQEINALFPQDGPVSPGKRFYFTESCALFADLRALMEERGIDQLLEATGLESHKLPVIWDADFFINSMDPNSPGRYTLCEINVSSVSPFPENAIPFIVEEVKFELMTRG